MSAGKSGGTVRTHDDRSHVFLLIVVVDTSEEGGDGTFPVRLASQGGHTVGGQWNIGQISVLEIIEV